ncbi:hypothetical protein [Haloarchaeobius sp. HME9146]|uniref:hypothetical protein n=1 Tax=Haloarchaeobius sp. HME9146 TaxID=2978732 RepID=UPI0021BF94BE|nr:hypothetical protein [Haloarchaeobius sp. HME9146]MCT9094844.1 hypothetical protein [Haloarchaeobius sp. HME9146]
MDEIAKRIVAVDLFVALTNVGTGLVVAGSVADPAAYAWVGVAVVAMALPLAVASDRSEAGMWVLIGVGSLGILGLLVGWATDTVPISVVPALLVGLGIALGMHRLVFGVLRPVPDARRARLQSG